MLPAAAASGGRPEVKAAEFVGMAAPNTPEAQATTTVGSALQVTYSDGSRQTFKLGYQPLFLTGDALPDGKGGTTLAGGYCDIAGKPIMDRSAEAPSQFYSDCPDGYSLLSLPGASASGVTGKTVFAVVQFEYTSRDSKGSRMYGRLPSPIAVLTLDQDAASGALKRVQYQPVDSSAAHGLWITCGASQSPWNTHLSSEEYEPDATAIVHNADFHAFSRNLFGEPGKANPYHYGHVPEVVVNPDGTGTLKKHYCLGRISHELVQVMPDRRTVLMGDDATNGGLFMFIADKPADLSAGSLLRRQGDAATGRRAGPPDPRPRRATPRGGVARGAVIRGRSHNGRWLSAWPLPVRSPPVRPAAHAVRPRRPTASRCCPHCRSPRRLCGYRACRSRAA